MGKQRPRLASRKNAKRWAKGQSSSSNPATTKYRDQARSVFFKQIPGKPGITQDDLKRHDALQDSQNIQDTQDTQDNQNILQPQFAKLDINEDELKSETNGTADTYNTFASNYSNCSNMSFNKFLTCFEPRSMLHKEMLAVLSAVTEIIKQNGGNETSTEYFAALMSTLEALEDEITIAATLSLLKMSMKSVPEGVLILKFSHASKILLEILSKYTVTESFLIVRNCISCLTVLLKAQKEVDWTDSSMKHALDGILTFTTHSKPKVRKSAQRGIEFLLAGCTMASSKICMKQVAMHCSTQLDATCEPGGITTVLHTLTLLKNILHNLPKAQVKIICEKMLSIMTLKNVLLTTCCLQTLHQLFLARPSEEDLPSQRNAQIINALYDYQPSTNDTQLTLAWLAVMQEAHCNLACTSSKLCFALISRIFDKFLELWLSDKKEVISGTSNTAKAICDGCVKPLRENEENSKYNSILKQLIPIMHKALSYQYFNAWNEIVHVLSTFIVAIGPQPDLEDIIKSLAKLRESSIDNKASVDFTVGTAIQVMGPQVVVNVLRLRVDKDTIDMKRTWLIPLLKTAITCGSLSFFTDTLLPIAEICEEKAKVPITGKQHEFLVSQIWSILPSICNGATDVKNNFKNIAKLLGMTICNRKDLKLPAMAALRKLIIRATESEKKDDIAELARFAKNYLPILFNLYTTKPNGTDEEGQRLAAFDTIKVYLTITSQDEANELFTRAMSKLNENADDFFRDSIYDLIRALIEYASEDKLKIYYDVCTPFLKDNSKPKEQKKAYRFLEELCGSNKPSCQKFVHDHWKGIQKMLLNSASSVIKTSRGARLKCLTYFFGQELVSRREMEMEIMFLQTIVPETVCCIKDINERCRNAAYELLSTIAQAFKEYPAKLEEYKNLLMAGLKNENGSTTLLALAFITYHNTDIFDLNTIKHILSYCCTVLTSPTREIVDAALSYVKVYLKVLPSINTYLTLDIGIILNKISEMTDDCKRHFRQKVRDILTKMLRKYGFDEVSKLIPASDGLLQKRLKNINKIEAAKRKKREIKRQQQFEDDSDTEHNSKRQLKSIEDILASSDDEFNEKDEKPVRNKKNTLRKEAWIQENKEDIVDLIDPTAARNITTIQPKLPNTQVSMNKPKDHGFKIAPDGRFIITDDNERDNDTKNKKKKKTPFGSEDESDDDDKNDDKSDTTTLKRAEKRKYSDVDADVVSLKSQLTSGYKTGGSGIHRPLKKTKTERLPGEEYRATKAGGDIKKKGKPDPYAYVPLTRTVLNKRKRKKNAGKFKNIISGAKKGARIGMKNKN